LAGLSASIASRCDLAKLGQRNCRTRYRFCLGLRFQTRAIFGFQAKVRLFFLTLLQAGWHQKIDRWYKLKEATVLSLVRAKARHEPLV
jgi:hypothetical protein